MKKATFTFTRQNLDTPWFWQVLSESGTPSEADNFITQNSDTIEQLGYITAQGYKNILTLTFTDEQIYEEWAAMVSSNVVPGYTQYCNENDITIEHVIEDI